MGSGDRAGPDVGSREEVPVIVEPVVAGPIEVAPPVVSAPVVVELVVAVP